MGLTTRLPLKRYKIHVCLRNFNYEISVVLNLTPCTFTGCCHIDPVNGIAALRSFNKLPYLLLEKKVPFRTLKCSLAVPIGEPFEEPFVVAGRTLLGSMQNRST